MPVECHFLSSKKLVCAIPDSGNKTQETQPLLLLNYTLFPWAGWEYKKGLSWFVRYSNNAVQSSVFIVIVHVIIGVERRLP